MKDASKKIINELTERGYRITKARTQVVEALTKASTPVSIQVVTEVVSADAVSVYRIIAMLKKERLIEEINIQGEVARYEVAHGHHHHVVCVSCNLLVHLSCDVEPATSVVVPGFASINSHELTYYGTCTQCE